MCVFKHQKEKKKRNGREEIFQRAMNENFSKLKKKSLEKQSMLMNADREAQYCQEALP